MTEGVRPPQRDVLDAPLRATRTGQASTKTGDALLLQRRVLTIDAYAAELRDPTTKKLADDARRRRFGSTIALIPVPLAPGESEEQYETKFIQWFRERDVQLKHLAHDVNRERSFRMSFAARVVRQWASAATGDDAGTTLDYIRKDGNFDMRRVPRHLMLMHEFMSLADFRRDQRHRRFAHLTELSYEEKQRRFGSPYSPIFVPLANGESKEQYEARFVRWVQEQHGMTLHELETHDVRIRERYMRLQFAAANAKGRERFEPPERSPKREREDDHNHDHDQQRSDAKKTKRSSGTECAGLSSVEACRTCGCRRCLLAAMRLLSNQIVTLETKANDRNPCDCKEETASELTQVVDLTPASEPRAHGVADKEEESDAVEQQLLMAYETVNELVVMNEQALNASAEELVELAATDITEAALRRAEDDQMRELIQEEIDKRTVALAMLVVYMHRHDLAELEKMISAEPAMDLTHVQRLSHHTCAELAVEITEIRVRLGAQQDADDKTVPNGLCATMKQLMRKRRQQFETLVRFDARLRTLIRTLLVRATVS